MRRIFIWILPLRWMSVVLRALRPDFWQMNGTKLESDLSVWLECFNALLCDSRGISEISQETRSAATSRKKEGEGCDEEERDEDGDGERAEECDECALWMLETTLARKCRGLGGEFIIDRERVRSVDEREGD